MTRRIYPSTVKSSVSIFVALGLFPGTLFLVSSLSAIKPQYRTCVLRCFEPSCFRSLQAPTTYRRRRPACWDPLTAPKCISSASSPDIGREADSRQEDAPPTEDDTFFPRVFSPPSRRSVRDKFQTPLEDPNEVVRMKPIDLEKASVHEGKAYDVSSRMSLAKGRTLRKMQQSDISRVTGLAIEEYCDESIELEPVADTTLEYITRIWAAAWELAMSQKGVDEGGLESFLARTEMEWMRTMIRWGFSERLSMGERGKDHSVVCVSDETWAGRNSGEGGLVALAELSLKIPNDKTALPIPLPLWVKKLFAWPRPVVPYISNLLVEPKARRQGLARVLMAQCEEQALKWGYSEVFLHVDITYTPAVRLYESLGYKPVGDDPVFEFDDEPHLRYMRKELRS